MFRELDTVVLSHDIEEHGLKEGDLGAVVHLYKDEGAAEVEFTTVDGKTIAVLTLTSKDVRRVARGEMLHVRGFSAA